MPLVRGRDGKSYSVMYGPDGRELSWVEVEVRDEAAYNAQRASAAFRGPAADDKNKLRRSEALKKRIQTLMDDMTAPPSQPEFRTISDAAFHELMSHPEGWEEDGFTPFVQYAQKVLPLRKMYPGEVGIVEKDGETPYFLVLEEGYTKGVIVSNPERAKAPDPAPVIEVRAYLARWGNGEVELLFAVDDDDALAMATEDRADDVTATPQFDRCQGHQMEVTGPGAIRCVTCGVDS